MKRLWFLLLLLSATVQAAELENIVLKAMIVNPSEDQVQVVPIELPLPREATKKDVIEMSEGLSLHYNSDQGVYVAMGEISLNPGEEKKIIVKINDVWKIPDQDIQFQKGYLPTLLKSLENTKYNETAKQLADSVASRLDNIQSSQTETVSPTKHIAIYRENLSVLKEIKKDVRFLEKLSAEQIPLSPDAIEVDDPIITKGTPADELATITLKMSVKNPSDIEKAILPVDYYLPREVTEKDVVSADGLEVRYDLNLGVVGVHKAEVELAPGEVKTYEIVVRDVWRVEPEKAQELEIKAAGFEKGLEGTQFETSAVRLAQEISELAKQIIQNQSKSEGQPIEEHIAIHIENLSLLAQMKEDIQKMARIEAIEATSPQTTPQSLGLGTPEGEADAGTSETPGKKGPEILAKTIFSGKVLDETTTWRLIIIIIGFLGFVSILFYLLWWVQVKMEKDMLKNEVSQSN